jgi:hypothetical protein
MLLSKCCSHKKNSFDSVLGQVSLRVWSIHSQHQTLCASDRISSIRNYKIPHHCGSAVNYQRQVSSKYGESWWGVSFRLAGSCIFRGSDTGLQQRLRYSNWQMTGCQFHSEFLHPNLEEYRKSMLQALYRSILSLQAAIFWIRRRYARLRFLLSSKVNDATFCLR